MSARSPLSGSRTPGPAGADSLAEVASQYSLMLASLPGQPQVESVAPGHGIVEGIQQGALYADLSTSSSTLVRRIDAALRAKGASAIDTPVRGGPDHCRSGQLIILVGGEDEQLESARPVLADLADLAKEIMHVGPFGAGAVAKLVNNACTLVTFRMLSELMSLGVKAASTTRPFSRSSSRGRGEGLPHTFVIPNVVFKHKFDPPGFALNLGREDVGRLTSLGRELNVPMPIANLSGQSAVELVGCGHGGDTSIVFSLQETRAGVVMHDDDADELEI
jgi:3-hydroxyisobutyrate dehydrogenase